MLLEIVAVVGVIAANLICYAFHHKSLIRYKWGGPKILFISNRAVSKAKAFPEKYWALDVLDPEHLVTSHFVNEVSVLLLRAFALAFFIVTLLLEGLTGDGFGKPRYWFTFFTNWTFLLFGIWSLWGVALTGYYIQAKLTAASSSSRTGRSEETERLTATLDNTGRPSQPFRSSKPRAASTAFIFLTEIAATSTLFLSFFYWTFLFSPKAPIEIDNLLKHGFNNLVLLLDVFSCRTPFVSYHYQAVLLYGSVYTLFMWIYHAASLHWVYWVLDWSKPTATGLYLLNPIFLFAAFLFWYCIALLREKIGTLLGRHSRATALQQADIQ